MKILIAQSAIQTGKNAIGDYTVLLATAMARHADVSIITASSDVTAPPGVAIHDGFSPRRLRDMAPFVSAVLAQQPDWLLIQYNPFAWGRWGLNPFLPLAVRQMRHQRPSLRVALMVHEPFVRMENLWENPKFALMTTWQRAQLWALGRQSERIFFSIENWARRFRRWFPHTEPIHLPVGSNIPPLGVPREQARGELALAPRTLALLNFGTSHPSRMVSPLRSVLAGLSQAGVEATLLALGTGSGRTSSGLEGLPVRSLGELPASGVSRVFAAADICLCPLVDGVTTRRGSFMAAISHGLPTVTTVGKVTDSILRAHAGSAFLAAPVGDLEAYVKLTVSLGTDPELRQRTGTAALDLYAQHFTWERIANRLLSHMDSPLPTAERVHA